MFFIGVGAGATEAHIFPQKLSSTHRLEVHLYRNWVGPTETEFMNFLYSFWRNPDGSRWTKNLCVVELDCRAKKWASLASVVAVVSWLTTLISMTNQNNEHMYPLFNFYRKM